MFFFVFSLWVFCSQLYFFPGILIAAPTDLNKFLPKTKKGICKRVCKQGYSLCDSRWSFYRKPKTAGRFLNHTKYADAAACGCPNQEEGQSWWFWFMGWLFGNDDKEL